MTARFDTPADFDAEESRAARWAADRDGSDYDPSRPSYAEAARDAWLDALDRELEERRAARGRP